MTSGWVVSVVCLVAVSFASGETQTGNVIEGDYCVLLKPGVAMSDLFNIIGINEVGAQQIMGRRTFLHLKITDRTYEMLENHELVEIIEPNRKMSLIEPVNSWSDAENTFVQELKQPDMKTRETCTEVPIVPEYRTWGLIRTSHRNWPNYLTENYRYSYTGKNVDIYVLDSGIDILHIDLNGRSSHGFVSSELLGDTTDYNGHGTHVAGISGGTTYGIANEANLISVKVLDSEGVGSYGGIIEGINYVSERVRNEKSQGKKPRAIINMSLGGTVYSQILYDAIEEAISQGITVLVAAGNENQDVSNSYPAAYDIVIAVGATDINDNFADFSNYGPTVDISAPGVDVFAAWSTHSSLCSEITPYQCGRYVQGTSQATPHVAGVVARYLEALNDTELSVIHQENVRDMLVQTSTTGAITFETSSQRTTPNRLLYKDCGRTDYVPTAVPTQPTPFPTEPSCPTCTGNIVTLNVLLFLCSLLISA